MRDVPTLPALTRRATKRSRIVESDFNRGIPVKINHGHDAVRFGGRRSVGAAERMSGCDGAQPSENGYDISESALFGEKAIRSIPIRSEFA